MAMPSPPERTTPLSVLAPVPAVRGRYPATTVADTIDLAWHVEGLGYHRFWVAEHHLSPTAAGPAPGPLVAVVAGATERLRVGAGAERLGHPSAAATAREFAALGEAHPGRIDLGAGPSAVGGARAPRSAVETPRDPARALRARRACDPAGHVPPATDGAAGAAPAPGPAPVAPGPTHVDAPGGAEPGQDGAGERGASVERWIVGGGLEGARWAGERGLPFAANHGGSPAGVAEVTAAYRAAFRPSARLRAPYALVSADVLVAEDAAAARYLAAGYGLWVRGVRTGRGAGACPTPDEALRHPWTDGDRALVADRVDGQFVGSPETVTAGLRALQEAAGADELLVATVTHDHEERLRSYTLLAESWAAAA